MKLKYQTDAQDFIADFDDQIEQKRKQGLQLRRFDAWARPIGIGVFMQFNKGTGIAHVQAGRNEKILGDPDADYEDSFYADGGDFFYSVTR